MAEQERMKCERGNPHISEQKNIVSMREFRLYARLQVWKIAGIVLRSTFFRSESLYRTDSQDNPSWAILDMVPSSSADNENARVFSWRMKVRVNSVYRIGYL